MVHIRKPSALTRWSIPLVSLGSTQPLGVFVTGGVEEQTRQVLTNLKHVLEAAGSSMGQVIKTTVFLKDMADFPKVNPVYGEFFPENPPVRSTVAVAGLPAGALVEIEVVALVG